MNKAAIVARVARRMGLNKFAAEGAVDTVLEAIAEGLAKEEDVRIAGFGTFRTRNLAARQGRNPATGESVRMGVRAGLPISPVRNRSAPAGRRGSATPRREG